MSDFRNMVLSQIELLMNGQVLEALDTYFAEYGNMYSNGELFGEGIAECRSKQEPFFASAKNITGSITELVIDEKSEFCAFKNNTSFDNEEGERQHIDGLHVQMWAGGSIASEWYFTGDLMHEIMESGVLSNPAHILELI